MATRQENPAQSILKDKTVRFFVILVLTIISVYLLYALFGVFFNYKIKGPLGPHTSKNDTVFIERISNANIPADTSSKKPQIIYVPISPNKGGGKEKDTVIKGKNVNTGTNNGIVGDNGVINKVEGPDLSEADANAILARV